VILSEKFRKGLDHPAMRKSLLTKGQHTSLASILASRKTNSEEVMTALADRIGHAGNFADHVNDIIKSYTVTCRAAVLDLGRPVELFHTIYKNTAYILVVTEMSLRILKLEEAEYRFEYELRDIKHQIEREQLQPALLKEDKLPKLKEAAEKMNNIDLGKNIESLKKAKDLIPGNPGNYDDWLLIKKLRAAKDAGNIDANYSPDVDECNRIFKVAEASQGMWQYIKAMVEIAKDVDDLNPEQEDIESQNAIQKAIDSLVTIDRNLWGRGLFAGYIAGQAGMGGTSPQEVPYAPGQKGYYEAAKWTCDQHAKHFANFNITNWVRLP